MINNTAAVKKGILFAVLACFIWSGNFIVARAVIKEIPPVSLGFFRWATASVLLAPFAWKKLVADRSIAWRHRAYFFWTALFGITFFNTFIYLAGHYTSALNLALIGTTSSPIIALVLARIFLGEKIPWQRAVGSLICVAGILVLLSKGHWETLLSLRFNRGDSIVLLGALSFAIYNVLVRRKPAGMHPQSFLLLVFSLGALMLLPGWLYEKGHHPPIQWTPAMLGVIAYLGIGTSIVSYLLWNAAIATLGAARTALFGNLIPLFASFEAALLLHEKITWLHIVCSIVIVAGLVIINSRKPSSNS
ncbi:MAG: DMT family transporter [Flavihumibacter sp.]